MTIGPHSDPNKSLSTGIAAHICGAKQGKKSPRYDPNQTPEQRKDISNAIWLCHDCSDMVDKDEKAYPAEKLREWKRLHEEFISTLREKGYASTLELLKPTLHEIQVAKNLIAFFEDRRVLYDLYEIEVPKRAFQSVEIVRKELTKVKAELNTEVTLSKRVTDMRVACRKFFEEVREVDMNELRWNPDDPNWNRFCNALSALRMVFGLQLAGIAQDYKISLEESLQMLVPR